MSDMNTNNCFQMSLPEGWVDQSIYIFNGPEAGGFKHNLTLVIDNVLEDNDLEAFAQERIDILLNSTPGTEVLKQEIKTRSSGQQACEAVIKWIPVDGTVVFQKKVFLIVDDIGYTFSANFSKQTIKTIGPEVERMIDSFQPKAE